MAFVVRSGACWSQENLETTRITFRKTRKTWEKLWKTSNAFYTITQKTAWFCVYQRYYVIAFSKIAGPKSGPTFKISKVPLHLTIYWLYPWIVCSSFQPLAVVRSLRPKWKANHYKHNCPLAITFISEGQTMTRVLLGVFLVFIIFGRSHGSEQVWCWKKMEKNFKNVEGRGWRNLKETVDLWRNWGILRKLWEHEEN